MRKLVDDVKQDVAAGNSLASSLRKRPQYFDELYCNLVDAGEQSGALETLLDRVATYKEKTEALKAKMLQSGRFLNPRVDLEMNKPELHVDTVDEWEQWLEADPGPDGVRLRLRKTATRKPGITYAEALDVAGRP